MNKVEIIKGIEETMKGLDMIREALREVDTNAVAPKEVVAPKKEVIKDEAPTETTEVVDGKVDVEQLKAMKYNDFKKFAASLGVKCTGTRDEIMQRILDLDTVTEEDGVEEEVVEEEVEEVVEEPKKAKPTKKLGKKKVEEVVVEDEFDVQAREIAEETEVSDIIEALADVDIKANKNNCVTLLAKALREGLIELDDEDEEEEEEVAEVVEDDIAEAIEADSYFPQFDPEGYNDPKTMTEDRAEAIETKMDSILTSISEEELTSDDIISYIEDNATEDEIELLGDDYSDDDLIKMYMELIKRTIDNEGVEHEPSDPYEVGERDLCCGHTLSYVKKSKKYVCSQCGVEYEAE